MLSAGQEGQRNGSVDGTNKRPRLATSELQDSSSDDEDSPRSFKERIRDRRESIISQRPVKPEERLAVDDVENPLQLLARASNLHLSRESSHDHSPGTAASYHPPASIVTEELDLEMKQVETFFGTTHFNVDRGEDYDPIELGLVTDEEAEMLFDL